MSDTFHKSDKNSNVTKLTATTSHQTLKASIDSAGRILVPAKIRRSLGIEPGDTVNLSLNGGVLEIRSLDDAIEEAQALVSRYVPQEVSLVDELIAERRQEAAQE